MSPFCDYGGHFIEKGKMCSHIVFLQITQYDNIIVIYFFSQAKWKESCAGRPFSE